jgi:hypothetical protein
MSFGGRMGIGSNISVGLSLFALPTAQTIGTLEGFGTGVAVDAWNTSYEGGGSVDFSNGTFTPSGSYGFRGLIGYGVGLFGTGSYTGIPLAGNPLNLFVRWVMSAFLLLGGSIIGVAWIQSMVRLKRRATRNENETRSEGGVHKGIDREIEAAKKMFWIAVFSGPIVIAGFWFGTLLIALKLGLGRGN